AESLSTKEASSAAIGTSPPHILSNPIKDVYAKPPTPSTNFSTPSKPALGSSAITSNLNPTTATTTPTKHAPTSSNAKDDDDYIPAFLLDSSNDSGQRRRRPPPPASASSGGRLGSRMGGSTNNVFGFGSGAESEVTSPSIGGVRRGPGGGGGGMNLRTEDAEDFGGKERRGSGSAGIAKRDTIKSPTGAGIDIRIGEGQKGNLRRGSSASDRLDKGSATKESAAKDPTPAFGLPFLDVKPKFASEKQPESQASATMGRNKDKHIQSLSNSNSGSEEHIGSGKSAASSSKSPVCSRSESESVQNTRDDEAEDGEEEEEHDADDGQETDRSEDIDEDEEDEENHSSQSGSKPISLSGSPLSLSSSIPILSSSDEEDTVATKKGARSKDGGEQGGEEEEEEGTESDDASVEVKSLSATEEEESGEVQRILKDVMKVGEGVVVKEPVKGGGVSVSDGSAIAGAVPKSTVTGGSKPLDGSNGARTGGKSEQPPVNQKNPATALGPSVSKTAAATQNSLNRPVVSDQKQTNKTPAGGVAKPQSQNQPQSSSKIDNSARTSTAGRPSTQQLQPPAPQQPQAQQKPPLQQQARQHSQQQQKIPMVTSPTSSLPPSTRSSFSSAGVSSSANAAKNTNITSMKNTTTATEILNGTALAGKPPVPTADAKAPSASAAKPAVTSINATPNHQQENPSTSTFTSATVTKPVSTTVTTTAPSNQPNTKQPVRVVSGGGGPTQKGGTDGMARTSVGGQKSESGSVAAVAMGTTTGNSVESARGEGTSGLRRSVMGATGAVDAEMELLAKSFEDKTALQEKWLSEKTLLEEHYESEMKAMKECHANEVQMLKKEMKDEMDAKIAIECGKLKVEQDQEVAALKQHNLDEMAKIISTAEAARTLEMLAGRVETSSRVVDVLQKKLESEHSYSVKERESSFQDRERQIAEIQELVKTMQTSMIESKKLQEEERRRIIQERTKLEMHMAELAAEKEEILHQLQCERIEFVRSREEWSIEKRRMLQQISQEHKTLAMEKAVLHAKRKAVEDLEADVGHFKSREEAQINSDRLILEKDLHSLQLRKSELHKEVAVLRAEKMRFESLRSEMEAERKEFESVRGEVERRVKDVFDVHSHAVKQRQLAQQFKEEAERICSTLEEKRVELERQHAKFEAERKKFILERMAAAKERTQVTAALRLVESAEDKENESKESIDEMVSPHETQPHHKSTSKITALKSSHSHSNKSTIRENQSSRSPLREENGRNYAYRAETVAASRPNTPRSPKHAKFGEMRYRNSKIVPKNGTSTTSNGRRFELYRLSRKLNTHVEELFENQFSLQSQIQYLTDRSDAPLHIPIKVTTPTTLPYELHPQPEETMTFPEADGTRISSWRMPMTPPPPLTVFEIDRYRNVNGGMDGVVRLQQDLLCDPLMLGGVGEREQGIGLCDDVGIDIGGEQT
ncbi:hypothetical protein HK102_001545, partial [Quaeritorhiza haematococci]